MSTTGFGTNNLGCHFTIGIAVKLYPLTNQLRANSRSIHQSTVVRERNKYMIDSRQVRLSGFPSPTASCGIAAVPHRYITLQG